MNGRTDHVGNWAPPLRNETQIRADTVRKAQLACADAAARGVFPQAELEECLRVLGLWPAK